MKKNRLTLYMQVLCALVLVASFGVSKSLAQDDKMTMQKSGKNVVKTQAQTSRGGGADTNIKTEKPTANDPKSEATKPAGRGRGCSVEVNNDTGWYVDIYVNGVYTGTVGPWGSGWAYPPVAGSNLYGRANFTDGSWKYWGPREFGCSQGSVNTWDITP
jgi:hypothetical protein